MGIRVCVLCVVAGVGGVSWGGAVSPAQAAVQGRIVRGVEGSIEPSRAGGLELGPVGREPAVREAAGRESVGRPGARTDEVRGEVVVLAGQEPVSEKANAGKANTEKANTEKAASEKVTSGKAPGKGASARGSGGEGLVNVNTASAVEIEALPGIGPSLAARILEYREKHGPFKRLEDLMQVRGVGEKNFLKLKSLITVGSTKAEQ